MQNIENDMDELFRKAVDQVPLLQGNNRWDEIAGKLSGRVPVSSAEQKEINTKRIIGMLGFFMLGMISFGVLSTYIKNNDFNIPGNVFGKKIVIHNEKVNNSGGHTSNTISFSTIKPSYFYPSATSAGNQPAEAEPGLKIDDRVSSPKRLNADIQDFDLSAQAMPAYNLNAVGYNNLLQKHSSIVSGERPENPANLPVQNLNKTYTPHFYLGPSGGILMSRIKNQELKKPGYDIGFLVGYKINKNISVETGLLFSKQYYFAGGKYYNSATGGNTVQSLEGSRTAYEIPFKLNYYVLRKKTGSFFISGGVSSYIGVNDKILINVGENTPGPAQKLDYGVASYLPSYLDFSLGYEHQFGRLTHMRIEPFVEIPINGTAGNTININAGNALQVFNAGVHLVITQFIH